MTQQQTVLITGANGKFGRHAARAFTDAGWRVRCFDRARDDLAEAAKGADVIVMGMHPPSYELWEAELLPLHDKVAAVARAQDVPVIVPGNLYGFGPGAGPVIGAETPMRAEHPLGLLRRRVEELYRDSGTRTIMLYCGDFLDDQASGNWFDMMIAKTVWKGRISYPGPLDVPHAWCWLGDAGRIAVELAERRETLDRFQPVPVPGYTLTGHELAAALSRATGHEVRAKRMSWAPMWLARPFVPVIKHLFEMRYLWSMPHRVEGDTLTDLLPDFTPTPVETALARATAPLQKSAREGGKALLA